MNTVEKRIHLFYCSCEDRSSWRTWTSPRCSNEPVTSWRSKRTRPETLSSAPSAPRTPTTSAVLWGMNINRSKCYQILQYLDFLNGRALLNLIHCTMLSLITLKEVQGCVHVLFLVRLEGVWWGYSLSRVHLDYCECSFMNLRATKHRIYSIKIKHSCKYQHLNFFYFGSVGRLWSARLKVKVKTVIITSYSPLQIDQLNGWKHQQMVYMSNPCAVVLYRSIRPVD